MPFADVLGDTPRDDVSVTVRFFRLVAMLTFAVGILALFYYVVHNLTWWGYTLLILILIASVIVASSRCRNYARNVLSAY